MRSVKDTGRDPRSREGRAWEVCLRGSGGTPGRATAPGRLDGVQMRQTASGPRADSAGCLSSKILSRRQAAQGAWLHAARPPGCDGRRQCRTGLRPDRQCWCGYGTRAAQATPRRHQLKPAEERARGKTPCPHPSEASTRSSSGNQRLPVKAARAVITASDFFWPTTSRLASISPASASASAMSALGTRLK
jgi:hypothetical protein